MFDSRHIGVRSCRVFGLIGVIVPMSSSEYDVVGPFTWTIFSL